MSWQREREIDVEPHQNAINCHHFSVAAIVRGISDRKGAYCAPITTQKGKEFFNICHIYEKMKSYDMSKGKTSLLDWILNTTALHVQLCMAALYSGIKENTYVIPWWHYSAAAMGHDFSY